MNNNNSNIDTIMNELVKPEILYKSLNEKNTYQLEELAEFGKKWNKIQQGSICGINGYFCNKHGCNRCLNPNPNPKPCPRA